MLVTLVTLVTLVALLGSLLAVISPPQAAHAEVTGTGGQYVPMPDNARVFSGGTTAGVYKTVKINGVDGLPATGIGAVSVLVTVASASAQGQLVGRPNAADPDTLLMIYGAGVGGNTSNTALLAVGDDGSIRVRTGTTQSTVTVDVTGYYTSTQNGVGAGGFVPMSGTRIANTINGMAVPQGPLTGGGSITFQVAGANGIPANAAAVALGVIVENSGGGAGWVRPYPTGGDKGSGVLNYVSTKGVSTSMTAQVAIGTDGKVTIDTPAGGGTIDVAVDVQGYFMASNPGGGFTPLTGRIIDTRDSTSVASNGSLAIQIAGARGGLPSVEGGLAAVAITLTAVHSGTNGGYAKAWGDGMPEPGASAINYGPTTSTRSTTTIVPVGTNGKIRVKNASTTATDFVVDLQGAYNSLPSGPASTNLTGQRTSATRLPFTISDQTNASVDVGTGNLMVSTAAMSLPGATSSTSIGVSYNSRSSRAANTNTMAANRWQYALAGAGDLTANASGVVYTDAAGTAWQFTPSLALGVGAFTTPAGLQQTLTRVSTSTTNAEYQLKGWTSNQVIHFNLAGQPTSIVDRNKNQTSFNTSDGYGLTTLVSTGGSISADQKTGARVATSSYVNGVQTFTQTSGSSSRAVSWAKSAAGDITTYTDATGKQTTFGYTDGDLTSITAPNGGVTSFTYDSSDRVTQVSQANTTAGSPGTAVTRLSYASDTSTQVADPRSDQNATVAAAKHTTYTLDGNDLVTKTVDPEGRERSKTYNSANNGVATSQVGSAGGVNTGTSTNKFDENNNQSITSSQGGSGSTSTATYGKTSATTYLPSKVTSSSSTSTSVGYDGVGNAITSQSGDDTAVQAKVEYNADGTVKTATAPGNGSNATNYSYDANKQLTDITPPTGTSLGVKHYTYDAFGRVATETDGRGNTTTFGYDNDDRATSTAFSDGTATVTNTYDGNGNQTGQTSATGTITNTYDQQNRLVGTVNTAGGGQVSYGYDLAGNTVQVTDPQGTVTHDYDSSNQLIATTYPTSSGTAKQLYKIDSDNGRRTDTWLAATPNGTADPTVWKAHQKLTYDKGGKVTRVQAWADSVKQDVVVDTTYCYTAGVAAGADCTKEDQANDRDKLQWSKDNSTGQVTSYGYLDTDGTTPTERLTGITQTGGSNPTNWAYTYDDAGNRLTAIATNAATGAETTKTELTYNAIGQITTTGYTYDGTGNLIAAPGETYTYNGAQQMTSSTKDGATTRYTYAGGDMNELLTQKTDGGADYTYTYGTTDSNGVPVITARTIAGTGTTAVLSDPATGQALDLRTTDGTTSMLAIDGVGNPAAAITDQGAKAYTVKYSPYGGETVTFGDTSAQWKQNPYGFKTGIRSSNTATGLTKFGMRWQAATTGGWIQRDTLDAPLNPSNANRYAFAGNDPVNQSDPRGQLAQEAGKGAVRLVASITGLYSANSLLTGNDTLAGFAAGTLTEVGCGLAAGAVGLPTLGIGGAVVGAACFGIGEYVSYQADKAVS
jgi:RHS repeat-associated protein